MFGVAGASLFEQADALADVITNRLRLRVGTQSWPTLLLGDALDAHEAHRLVLATPAHELSRRAGLDSVAYRVRQAMPIDWDLTEWSAPADL